MGAAANAALAASARGTSQGHKLNGGVFMAAMTSLSYLGLHWMTPANCP